MCPKYFMGYTDTKTLFIAYLKFTFNWCPIFLFAKPGNPNHENILLEDTLFTILPRTLYRNHGRNFFRILDNISLSAKEFIISWVTHSFFFLLDTVNHVWSGLELSFWGSLPIGLNLTEPPQIQQYWLAIGNEEKDYINQTDKLDHKKIFLNTQKLKQQQQKNPFHFLSQSIFDGLKEKRRAGWARDFSTGRLNSWWSQGPAFGSHKPTSFRQNRNVSGNRLTPWAPGVNLHHRPLIRMPDFTSFSL